MRQSLRATCICQEAVLAGLSAAGVLTLDETSDDEAREVGRQGHADAAERVQRQSEDDNESAPVRRGVRCHWGPGITSVSPL